MLPFVLLAILLAPPGNPAVLTVPIQSPPFENYVAYASTTAQAHGLNVGRFLHTISCESNWDPEAKGDYVNGIPTSIGIAQFRYPERWGLSTSTASNPYLSIDVMAKAWKAGLAGRWSCYSPL